MLSNLPDRPSPRSPRADAALNRARILAAAREVFAVRGLQAEVREVAERAGVGVGTIYRHFESRQGLLAAMKAESTAELRESLGAGFDPQDPRATVRAIIHAGAEACERFGALAEAVLSGSLDVPGSNVRGDLTVMLTGVLERGVATGAFRANLDVPVAVGMLEAMFTSGALMQLGRARSFAGAADAIADLYLAAIEARRTDVVG